MAYSAKYASSFSGHSGLQPVDPLISVTASPTDATRNSRALLE